MRQRRWNVRKAALCGAAFGIPLAILRGVLLGGPAPQGPAEIMGYLTAGMIVGALLFAGAAAIRNLGASSPD